MSQILISGLVNMETTVQIEEFPIPYTPINYNFFGVHNYPAGVGLNLSMAFHTLGDDIALLSIVGKDLNKDMVCSELIKAGITTKYLDDSAKETATSAILYDQSGAREIYCDLKDIQELNMNKEIATEAMKHSDIVCLCNINFSRELLYIAHEQKKVIATDVQVIHDIHDSYNEDFMRYANILFLSNEEVKGRERSFLLEIVDEYHNDIIVMGMGKDGALLYTKESGTIKHYPSVFTRDVVNTVGAGDSMFASFLHFYRSGFSAEESLKRAIVFASYKVGESSAAKGFLTESEVETWYQKVYKN